MTESPPWLLGHTVGDGRATSSSAQLVSAGPFDPPKNAQTGERLPDGHILAGVVQTPPPGIRVRRKGWLDVRARAKSAHRVVSGGRCLNKSNGSPRDIL